MKSLFPFYFFLFYCGIGYGQNSPGLISSTNHTLTNAQVSFEIAVGEPFTELFSGSQHSVTHGFLQPDPLVKVNPITPITEGGFKIYPNPFNQTVMIACEGSQFTGILMDQTGRTVLQAEANTLWDVSNISIGLYILQIIDKNGHLVHTTKLCKLEI